RAPTSTLLPYTTLFRSGRPVADHALFPALDVVTQAAIGVLVHHVRSAPRLGAGARERLAVDLNLAQPRVALDEQVAAGDQHDLADRKSTRLNSSHLGIS